MPPVRYTYGIRIEGIGEDTSKSEGLCFYWGNRVRSSQLAASDYEWVGGPGSAEGMINLPEGSDSTVSIWTADLSLSSITPRLHLSDTTGRALMRQVLEPVGYLTADLGEADTTVKFTDDVDSSYEGTVIYLGDEAILLGTVAAGSDDGEEWFENCTRGFWGTHSQALPQYTRAYDAPPYRDRREVTLVRYDHSDDSEETRWFGSLNDSPPTNDDYTTLDVAATEVFSRLKQATVNKGSPDLSAKGEDVARLDGTWGRPDVDGFQVQGEIGPLTGRLSRLDRVGPDAVAVRGAFQVADSLVFSNIASDPTHFVQYGTTAGARVEAQLGTPRPEELDPVFQLLVVSAEIDLVNGVSRDRNAMYSGTAALDYPFHPIAVWLALTVDHEDYDVLGDDWNLGAPAAWFDLTDIEETIEATRHVVIDRLILGWDGEEVNPWEHFKRACRTYGFFPCIRSDGRISVRETREAGPAEVFGAPTVTARPYRLHHRPSEADGVDVISGRYGELPWAEGSPYVAMVLDFSNPDDPVPVNSRRSGVLADRNQVEFDMPTRSNVAATGGRLQSLAAARHVGAPRLGIRVDDDGFGHGDFVRLAPLDTRGDVLRDDTGERVAVDQDSAKWVGLVSSKKSMIDRDIADIDLHLANWHGKFPRWRSASAVVASVSGTTVTLEQGVFADDDGDEFTSGDQVEVWAPDFTRRGGGVRTIDAINTDEIELDDTTDIEAGDILELAYLDDAGGYPENGNPNLYSGLAYAYLGDASSTIGPSDDEAHIYGSGAG